jgi:hypothetical protein
LPNKAHAVIVRACEERTFNLPIQQFGCIYFAVVRFNRFGHDDGGSVSALDGLCGGGDGSCDVARRERKTQNKRDKQRNNKPKEIFIFFHLQFSHLFSYLFIF